MKKKIVSYNGYALELHQGDQTIFQVRLSKLGNLKVFDSGDIGDTDSLIEISRELSGSTTPVEPVSHPREICYA